MIRKILFWVIGLVLIYVGVVGAVSYADYQRLKASAAKISAIDQDGYEQIYKDAESLQKSLSYISPIISLSPALQSKYLKLEKIISAKQVIDKITSFDQERTFLVVMQNNAELRPSGGFWGSYGILKIKDAKITSFVTANSYDLDIASKGKFNPPSDVSDIIADEWRFWNANWSPDFKVSVEQGLFFYRQVDPNIKFDGVLGPNVDYLLSVLSVTGPVDVPNHDFKVSTDNFVKKMIYEPIDPALYNSRKDDPNFVFQAEKKPLLSEIAKNILDAALAQGNLKLLALKSFDALQNKDLLVYLGGEADENEVTSLGWGGRINPDQNFVSVVDANLGSKLDFNIEKKFKTRQVSDLEYEGTLTYRNTYGQDDLSHTMKNYRTLTRVFLPPNSTLISSSGGQRVATMNIDAETGASYVNTLLILEPEETSNFTFRWKIPEKYIGLDLKVERQSGSKLVVE